MVYSYYSRISVICHKFILILVTVSVVIHSCEIERFNFRLKQIRESNVTDEVVISFNKTENDYIVANYSEFVTVLVCTSPEPIEWVYEGKGSPNLVHEEYLDGSAQENGESSASCKYSELFFRHEENYLKRLPFHTGKYICRSIGHQTDLVSVYLYFPRIDGQMLLNNDGRKLHTIKHAVSSLPGFLTLPCLSTNPAANISLFKRKEKEQASPLSKKIYEKLKNVAYNPKIGFTLEYSSVTELFGEYKCSTGQRKDFMIFNVVEDKDVKVYPNETVLFTSTQLNLTCEAEEPVVIHLVAYGQIQPEYYDDRDEAENLDLEDIVESETTEHTEFQSHVANYIDLHPSVGDVGEFQCLSEIDAHVLHSWVYQIISKEADTAIVGIKFNESSKTFSCQTKTSLRGKLSFVLCDSPSECQINRKCLETFDNCRGYKKLLGMYCDWEKDCREIVHHSGTGYIRCVDDGVDEILGFADLPGGLYIAKNLTSIKPKDAAILSYEVDKVVVGQTLRVVLKKWNYLFSKNHRWAYRFQNGTSVLNSKYDNLGSAKFEVLPDLEFVECMLMRRFENNWYNVSLPILVHSTKPLEKRMPLNLNTTSSPAEPTELNTSV